MIRYKRFKGKLDSRGKIVPCKLVGADGHPIKDIEGNYVYCDQRWNAPKVVKQFGSAVAALHKAKGHIGEYQVPCDDCCVIDRSGDEHGNRFGCKMHRGNPLLVARGLPNSSETIINAIKQTLKDGERYVESGDTPLTAFELLKVRQRLLSTNDPQDFQLCVLILISVRLFLRSSEASGDKTIVKKKPDGTETTEVVPTGIEMSAFMEDLAIIGCDGSVERLAIKIKGKTDQQMEILFLYCDEVNPALCPILHLLAYVHYFKIKAGHLFPSLEELKEPPANGNYVTYIKYQDLQKRMQDLFKSVTGRDGPFGTHTIRKTAYLLAMWGFSSNDPGPNQGMNFPLIMSSARHSDAGSALRYCQDALALKETAIRNGLDVARVVSPWRAVKCENPKMHLTMNRSSLKTSLYLKAKEFVKVICQLGSFAEGYAPTILDVVECVMKYRQPRDAKGKSLNMMQKAGIDQQTIDEISQLIDEHCHNAMLAITQPARASTKRKRSEEKLEDESEDEEEIEGIEETNEAQNKNKAKRQRIVQHGSNNYDERSEFAKLVSGYLD